MMSGLVICDMVGVLWLQQHFIKNNNKAIFNNILLLYHTHKKNKKNQFEISNNDCEILSLSNFDENDVAILFCQCLLDWYFFFIYVDIHDFFGMFFFFSLKWNLVMFLFFLLKHNDKIIRGETLFEWLTNNHRFQFVLIYMYCLRYVETIFLSKCFWSRKMHFLSLAGNLLFTLWKIDTLKYISRYRVGQRYKFSYNLSYKALDNINTLITFLCLNQ